MQFPRHCVAPRVHIVGIATFVDTVESSPNRIACETAASARELPAFLAARGDPLIRAWVRHFACGSAIAGAGPLIRAWAAPWRISRVGVACRGVNAHCRRFACERRTSSGAVAPTTQTTLPATPRCRRLLSRWFATWAALPRGATSPTVNCGNCATRGPVRYLPAGDTAIKRGELHH